MIYKIIEMGIVLFSIWLMAFGFISTPMAPLMTIGGMVIFVSWIAWVLVREGSRELNENERRR